MHMRLKIISAKSGRTIEDLLRDAVAALIEKHHDASSEEAT
jgi:predicted DNA-binding protein